MSSKALTEKILRTAEEEAEQITNDALKRAAETEKIILGKAEAECAAIVAAAEDKAAQKVRTAELMSSLDARKAYLHARREVIESAYGEAVRRLLTTTDSEKLDYLKNLIIKYAPEPVIIITVSVTDAHLFTPSVISELQTALTGKFGSGEITLGEPSAEFCGGVYMTGTNTDTDATYETIFEQLREDMFSTVDGILFADGNT